MKNITMFIYSQYDYLRVFFFFLGKKMLFRPLSKSSIYVMYVLKVKKKEPIAMSA